MSKETAVNVLKKKDCNNAMQYSSLCMQVNAEIHIEIEKTMQQKYDFTKVREQRGSSNLNLDNIRFINKE